MAISLFTLGCAEAHTISFDASTGEPDGGATTGDAGDTDAMGVDCTSELLGWHALGGPLSASAEAGSDARVPSLVVDAVSAEVVVAWAEGVPADAHVRRWDGDAWQLVGSPISVNPDNSSVYSVHLAAQGGALVVAHAEAGGETSSGFYAHRLTSGAWEIMGGGDLSTSNVNTSGGAVAFDDAGDAVVVWSQYPPGEIGRNRIHVRRFTGLAYIPLDPELGGVAGPGASAITPSLAFDSTGTEVIAFSESGVRTFRRNQGDTSWEAFGGEQVEGIPGVLGAHSPHLAAVPGSDPYLALAQYDQNTSTSNGYLLQWTGSVWQSIGGAMDIVPGEHSYVRALTIDGDGDPVVALTEGAPATGLYLLRWNGSGFVDMGTLPLSGHEGAESVFGAALATDGCGRVVVAFSEADTGADRAVHVYRFYD